LAAIFPAQLVLDQPLQLLLPWILLFSALWRRGETG
jgi:hypothetical protein